MNLPKAVAAHRCRMLGAIAIALGWLVSFQGSARAAADSTRPPNVMIILSDDQGSIDLNCFGAKDLYTPHLDQLSSEGVRFTQMYAAFPVCAPSRGSLLTGRYPQHNGVTGNGRQLRADEVTIAEMLRGTGYHTTLVGKWHLGKDPGPNGQGFDSFFGHMGGCIENYNHDNYAWDTGVKRDHDLWRNTELVYEKDTHFGELIVRETNRFLEENRSTPFFAYVAFNNPHYPVQPLPKHLERYKDMKEPRRSYAAFLSTLDEQIGKILAKLEELNLRKRTLVVFLSDQGHSVEKRNNLWIKDADPDMFGGGSAGPYRGNKFTLWEGGIRVPCIMSMPGTIPQGQTRDQMVCSIDLLPTIADYCGVTTTPVGLDGTDIRSVIESAKAPAPRRVLHWMMGPKHWAVRDGKWKLVYDKGTLFLSDMDRDVREQDNLAEQFPEEVQCLQQLHQAWVEEVRPAKQ